MSRRSRYQRPRRLFSIWGLVIGLVIGAAGSLFYAWQVEPVRQVDTAPRQLNAAARADYIVAIALRFGYDSDLNRALSALIALNLGGDPFQAGANAACELASTGYVDSTAGIRALRTLKTFYQLQGKSGCADQLIDDATPVGVVTLIVPTRTPTLIAPPTKTATPLPEIAASGTPQTQIVPTTRPRQRYEGNVINTFCASDNPGTIEITVRTFNGDGIPGQRLRVRWNGGSDEFSTGLKPERDAGYADFQMQAGFEYTLDMPGQSDPLTRVIVANDCITAEGQDSITSYRVTFTLSG